MNEAKIISGGIHIDQRGKLGYVNDFDLSPVKRFYHITHPNTDVIRAWQGHQIEVKWFTCIKGSFRVNLIKIENWKNPSSQLRSDEFILTESKSQVLHIPGGYVNGFQALENDSTLLVFSDKTVAESTGDDFRFDASYWKVFEKI